jgi:hypothetical protein
MELLRTFFRKMVSLKRSCRNTDLNMDMRETLGFKFPSDTSKPGVPNSSFQSLNIKYSVNASDIEANVHS